MKVAAINKSIGYDGVEVHAMHWGYLLDEFAMSITNHRTDEYGGSLENRMRMAREIVTGIKQECGSDFPVIMRLGLKSYIKGLNKASFDGSEEAGRTLEEGIAISKLLEEYGYDAIDMDMGIYDSFYYACPPSYIPQGFAIDLYAQAKKAVNIPVLAGSRMQDPFMAEQAIADGKIDGVVLTRPALADADLPRKISAGKPERVRPCIACCQCFRRGLDSDEPVLCAVNPELFREYDKKLRPAVEKKKVMIVGGGAGGMEAARAAKLCGHEVELYEKSSRLGGLMWPAGEQKMKVEMHQLINWYTGELDRLGVPVHLNTEVTTDMIKAAAPDVVILSAGSEPSKMQFISGVDKPQVIDCVTALMDKDSVPGQNVVVIGGGHVGCETAAELMLSRGKTVTIIELADKLLSSPLVPSTIRMCLTDMMDFYGVKAMTGSSVQSINDGSVTVRNAQGETVSVPADNVVLAAGFTPNPSMAGELYGLGIEVYEIGNGLPTANVLQATQEGFEIATRL